MKKLLKVLAFIPLIIQLIIPIIIYNKIGGIILEVQIPMVILLLITAIGVVSNKKNVRAIGLVALIILTLFLGILGYYDFIKWFSSIVGIIILGYFLLLRKLIRKTNENM